MGTNFNGREHFNSDRLKDGSKGGRVLGALGFYIGAVHSGYWITGHARLSRLSSNLVLRHSVS